MEFNCLKAGEPLQGNSLLFTTNFPEITGTHLTNNQTQKDERLSLPNLVIN